MGVVGGRIIYSPQDGMGLFFLRKRLKEFTFYAVTQMATDLLAIRNNFMFPELGWVC